MVYRINFLRRDRERQQASTHHTPRPLHAKLHAERASRERAEAAGQDPERNERREEADEGDDGEAATKVLGEEPGEDSAGDGALRVH